MAGLLGLSALGNIVAPSDEGSAATPFPTTTSTALPTVAPTPSPVPTAEPTPTEIAFGPTGPTEVATVTRVIDGDTIVVDIDGQEYRLRYIGMDTEEPDAEGAEAKAMAAAASEANAALVGGKDAILERDDSDTDQFDRLLRHVWVETDGGLVMVGMELVRRGLARASSYPPDVKYDDLLLAAEQQARSNEVGLWAPKPTPTPEPTPTPTPAPVVETERVDVYDQYTFGGADADYLWADVGLWFESARYRVSGTAEGSKACRVTWSMFQGEARNGFTLKVGAGKSKTTLKNYDPAIDEGTLSVKSTCKEWSIEVTAYVRPTPKPESNNCHPSYKGACLKPDASDYDCAGGSGNGPYYVRGPIRVVGYDVYDLDRDGDGIGCD